MIPSVLARQLRQGVEDFLQTTFPISSPFFHGIIDRLLTEKGSVFKGPYLSIQLPFRQGAGDQQFFPQIPLNFKPYLHQEQAFRRLGGPTPRSTIVATGTGSGKTESFLYPILDHCYRHRGEPGIKAILIYPMNALALDQAERLAKIIWQNPHLKGHVNAGLFVGRSEKDPSRSMAADRIITNKDTQRLSPPDILLTNYKMLDYLLIRPKDFLLWQHNGPETLQYLVVDELHTFDGAQGTDLACLIRRLKDRVKTPAGFLCCVGTSATLGSEGAGGELREYAQAVFGEPFDEEAVVSEARLNAGEFLGDNLISRVELPPPARMAELDPEADSYNGYPDYLRTQHRLWFDREISEAEWPRPDWRVDLGERLKEHLFFQNLLKVLGGKVRSYEEVLDRLEQVTPELREADSHYREFVLNSLLALVSEARLWQGEEQLQKTSPFLHVRLHYWLRELRRIVGEVKKEPCLRFADDLQEDQLKIHLPVVHCRECGAMGWAGLNRQNDKTIISDLQSFYIGFFNNDAKVVFLFPEAMDIKELGLEGEVFHLCEACLHMTPKQLPDSCPYCGYSSLVRVFVPDSKVKKDGKIIGVHNCPYCNARDSLTILGSRAASLTSVMIAQLYASGFNDDKKLLTFSDSVQDAAHRAGFFSSRTYRFNLRTALQRFVQFRGEGMTLAELPKAFCQYWLDELGQNNYVATFLAPSMMWFREYDLLKNEGSLPAGSDFLRKINNRLGWEIFSEYGFSARIGRTLEKTGSSVAHVDQEVLVCSAAYLLEVLQNELGELRDLDEVSLVRFLLGLLVHLKNQGAVYHPVLGEYIEKWGNTYLITQKHIPWMPNFGPKTRAPIFLTTKTGKKFDQLFSKSINHRTWYQVWALKCFGHLDPFLTGIFDKIYTHVLKALTRENLLLETTVQGHPVWGINPEYLRISQDVQQWRCRDCGHQITTPAFEKDYWNGAPCLRFNCGGEYREQEKRHDYYGKLYATGAIQRIFAAEHTGLLSRDDREKLEQEYKSSGEDRQPWYPNLLSCTPTLEMGIDIGDLSAVILCSVPPSQPNYLQRIGRAGRRDGNSLNLTVANARPHDLYFFGEPEDMIAGEVESPGVFLNASAVLERQLTAFCFDRWIESGIKEAALPSRLGQVLNNLVPVDNRKFPHNFLRFIENHQTELFDGFFGILEGSLTEDSVAHLRVFIEGDHALEGGLRYQIIDKLHGLSKERDSLKKKVRLLRDRIKHKMADPVKDKNFSDELNELQQEKEAFQILLNSINERDTFNFFTDEGLIPNYAFPEAGILLRSIIYRRKEEIHDGESKYETLVFDYQRPAVSAIDELAPENNFYSGGRKVTVDQVDMGISQLETWRFCPDCSHMESAIQEEEVAASCPRCGDVLWADAGQKREMVRMRQVFATTNDRDSRIGDENEDREPNFYNKQLLVDFEDRHITDAYKVEGDEFPFGFEFLSKVTFREVNFGEKGENGDQLKIAGVESPKKGFIFCRHCGKIQDRKGDIKHALTCVARDQESEKNFIRCVYLYREFSSEAIRILLPSTTFAGSDRALHSFVAALQLGLKKKFAGKIDHLHTTVSEEPIPESSQRKRYLVLYDKVPGGTGYLKQLMRSEQPLFEVFDLALEVLRSCPCHLDPAKDGCYRCLFAYRSSYHMAETSRDTAIKLLSEITSCRGSMVKTENLRNVSMISIFGSELEARFIEAFRRLRKDELPVALTKELVNGKPGYLLKIKELAYYIEPQVNLGPADGVDIPAQADFVFSSARSQDQIKPIAVFTDGYLYHRDRIGQDMAQRMAIVQSNNFLVWSLSWKDVENQYNSQGDYFRNYLDPGTAPNGNNFKKMMEGFNLSEFQKVHQLNSFESLIHFLLIPDEKLWQRYAFAHGLVRLDVPRFNVPDAVVDWREKLNALAPENLQDFVREVQDPCLYGLLEYQDEAAMTPFLNIFLSAEHGAVKNGNAAGMVVASCLFDESANRQKKNFDAVWNGYLRLYNFWQFFPNAFFITQQGMEKSSYGKLKFREGVTAAEGKQENAWREVFEVTAAEIHPLLNLLQEREWPLPLAGFELSDAAGIIIATAELGWPELKLALLEQNELDYKVVFEENGWQVYPLSEVLANPEEFMAQARQ